MEANYLTDLRTAATSAVATDLLARKDAETLGIFGSGRQAEAHLAALPRVRNFKRFLVCGSGRSDLSAFCEKMKTELAIQIEPASAETVARESDVICTCTTASEPLFDGTWLRPGTHLNLVGAFQPETREVDDITVKRARVVVDTYDGALAEAGDLLIPIKSGAIDRSHIMADLHEIASGKKPGRIHQDDITLFKSVGCALEDLVTAKLILRIGRVGVNSNTKRQILMKHYDFAILGARNFWRMDSAFSAPKWRVRYFVGCLRPCQQPRQLRRRDPRDPYGLRPG